jgi:hypothetical protein
VLRSLGRREWAVHRKLVEEVDEDDEEDVGEDVDVDVDVVVMGWRRG